MVTSLSSQSLTQDKTIQAMRSQGRLLNALNDLWRDARCASYSISSCYLSWSICNDYHSHIIGELHEWLAMETWVQYYIRYKLKLPTPRGPITEESRNKEMEIAIKTLYRTCDKAKPALLKAKEEEQSREVLNALKELLNVIEWISYCCRQVINQSKLDQKEEEVQS